MKTLFTLILLVCSFLTFGQSKCKFETVKNPVNGHFQITGIVVALESGKCVISKSDTTIKLFYKTSSFNALLAAKTNDVSVDLETAEFVFDDDSKIRSIITGYASAENRQVLKVKLSNPYFSIALDKILINKLMKSETLYIRLFGEKDSEGYAIFNKKEIIKIKQALACM